MDEFGLIAELFAPLAAGYPGALNLKDDAALVEVPPGQRLVITSDAIVAGVHFLPDDPPDLIARKLMRVNLSDLAAMGAEPVAVLLAAAFRRDATADWLRRFAKGLAEDVAEFNVPLIGGDTVATPGPLTLTLTALGRVEAGRALLRSAARPGDVVYVSGTIGDAALGLKVALGELPDLAAEEAEFLAGRYRLPCPRTALGPRLAGIAHAAMDVSDGLCADLGHICRASQVGAVIEAARIPLSAAARSVLSGRNFLLASILGGGDDYELLFTAPVTAADLIAAASAAAGVPVTAIGRVIEGDGVKVVDGQGDEITQPAAGYRHFS